MWQQIYAELKSRNFTIITVAMESRGEATARPWIEAAKPEHPSLIDREHHVADLYNMVNVPQAVWIDEAGRIVRPTETAGASDSFRGMDRKTFSMSKEAQAERAAIKNAYVQAIRDWALSGRHALPPAEAKARMPLPDAGVALANANFRLGRFLVAAGAAAEGQAFLAEAARLRPESWNIWRQAADLDEIGKAGSPSFWARVDALGDRPYYVPATLD